jgi:hypothetical protein
MDQERNPQQQSGSGSQQPKPGQTPAPVWEQSEKGKDQSGQQGGTGGPKPGGSSEPGGGQKTGTGQQGGGQSGGQNR